MYNISYNHCHLYMTISFSIIYTLRNKLCSWETKMFPHTQTHPNIYCTLTLHIQKSHVLELTKPWDKKKKNNTRTDVDRDSNKMSFSNKKVINTIIFLTHASYSLSIYTTITIFIESNITFLEVLDTDHSTLKHKIINFYGISWTLH